MKRRSFLTAAMILAGSGFARGAEPAAGGALQALDQLAAQQKYAFIVFYKEDSTATRAMAQAVAKCIAARPDQAGLVYVKLTDTNQKPVVDRFAVGRAPMPLAMVVAPNGAITGAYPQQVTDAALAESFVTPAMAGCMKSMQQGRLVFLCVRTSQQEPLPAGVADFRADPDFQGRSDIVALDATDPAEAALLAELQIDAAQPNSTRTVFFAPPGVLVGKFEAQATKVDLAAALHKAGKCCNDPNCKHARGQTSGGVR